MRMGKLLAIDGLSIVRRVYEASTEVPADADISTAAPGSPGRAELALRHALSSFKKLLSLHQPTHVLPAFDFGGSTWRHELYPHYREKREPMPTDLKEALPGFYDMLTSLGMHPLSVPQVEADDVIATAVLRWLHEQRGDAIVVSTDKDLHGLIADGALVWDHFKHQWRDRAWVEAKFGVAPEQMTELLALAGDPADGIPGVGKVGMKTAARLLRNYGNLDAVMAGAGILKGTLGENLRRDADLLQLSRRLVELKTDVHLGVTWNMLAWAGLWHSASSS
jgi:protein Xni